MSVYREGMGQYAIARAAALSARYRQWQDERAGKRGRTIRKHHGLEPHNPLAGGMSHEIARIDRLDPETIAFLAIGGNWQALELLGYTGALPEIEVKCSKCQRYLTLNAFGHDAKNTRRYCKRSWCQECERAAARESYRKRVHSTGKQARAYRRHSAA